MRICIYPKDVQKLTGRSERYGRDMLKKIRIAYQIPADLPITIAQFCQYTGFNVNEVKNNIS